MPSYPQALPEDPVWAAALDISDVFRRRRGRGRGIDGNVWAKSCAQDSSIPLRDCPSAFYSGVSVLDVSPDEKQSDMKCY